MTISMVLYGRNDNYGYNLHKRAALSLNCMAELLTDSTDEILFVDYNTPDDFPTFPEAIQDTLTKRVRDLLRILRVRPRLHRRFRSKTHLVALEPIARNVAIRRSHRANRWVLSTNTDMIFVPRGNNSLSNIVRDLAAGFYHAPRIEIPEVLWESLDRHEPTEVIATVREWGSTLHLNEIILGAEFILYDGPGDFQLLLRDDLFENHGFHEEMLLGWHVDSNIAKRMYLKYGRVGDLGADVYGYHCDHTRQVTPAHSHARLQNDWRRFCNEVDRPDIPEQSDIWGCVNDTIEEVRLVANPASVYVQALRDAVGSPLTGPQVSKYTHETYNRTDYDPRHMVPFLADMFASMPRSSDVAWYGAGLEMLSRFTTVWDRLGFSGRILVDPELVRPNDQASAIEFTDNPERFDRADAFVFDFGGLPGSPRDADHSRLLSGQLLRRFLDAIGIGGLPESPRDADHNRLLSGQLLRRFLGVIREEQRRISAGLPLRRVIALNAINNQFEHLITGYIAAAATPCATHMRHGFVLPAKSKDEWLQLLQIGPAGVRDGERINSDPRRLGDIAHGPYKHLDAGWYRLSIEVTLASDEFERDADEPCLVIVIGAGPEVFASYLLCRSALAKPDHNFLFAVPPGATEILSGVETRIMLFNPVALSIQALTIEKLAADANQIDADASHFSPSLELDIDNWLPFLSLGALGRTDDAGIVAQTGPSNFVVFGPYWPLPVGHYVMVVQIEYENELLPLKHLIRADVVTGNQELVAANFHLDPQGATTAVRLPFELSGDSSAWRQIETRIWSSGEVRFRIHSLSVTALEQSGRRDLLPFLLLGEVGRRSVSGINNVEGRTGILAYSPCLKMSHGHYRMDFRVAVSGADQVQHENRRYGAVLIKSGDEIIEVFEIASSAGKIAKGQLLFEVPSSPYAQADIEVVVRVIRAANMSLRALSIEPVEAVAQRESPAVLSLRDWLPYLQKGKSAHAGEDGVAVSEGVEEFVVYGPFWSLPAGRYEMLALVAPRPQNGNNGAVVAAEVTAEDGERLFAQGKWQLDRYKLTAPTATVEFRLPFSLSGDLPAAARTIETRFFTSGDASFRILSLTVTTRSNEQEVNLFPYLIVEECGIHTGAEIIHAKDGIGYVARSLPIRLAPGHYRISTDMASEAGEHGGDAIAFEVWSGSDLIAIGTLNSKSDKLLEFDVADELSEEDLELRIRAIAPVPFSIRRLSIDNVSAAIAPGSLPDVLGLKDWLPFLRLGPVALRGDRRVIARPGQSGYVVFGPYWRLPAGSYVAVFAIELDQLEKVAVAEPARLEKATEVLSLRKRPAEQGADITSDGGADVMSDGRQIAVVSAFTIDSSSSRSTAIEVPFEIAAEAKIGSKLETRVWTTGRTGFSIRTVCLRRRTPNAQPYMESTPSIFRLTSEKIAARIRALRK